MPSLKPEQLDLHIKSGQLGPLYLFDGPEPWLKKRAVQRIINRLLTPETKDFNLNQYNGNSSPASEVVSTIQSMPFLGDRRVVIVDSADEWNTADRKLVAENLENIPTSTCLVLLYDSRAGLRDEIPAHVASHGHLVTFWTPFENQLPEWAITETRQRGKTLEWPAAKLLCDSCKDLEELSNEIDKLLLYVGKKTSLSMADVRAHGLPDTAADFKDLETALWNRDLTGALRQGQLLLEMGVRTEALFPAYQRVFRTLLLGRYYQTEKKWDLPSIFEALGMRGKTQQGLFSAGLKNYSSEELKISLGKIVKTDEEIKTGALANKVALSLLTMDLLKKKEGSVIS